MNRKEAQSLTVGREVIWLGYDGVDVVYTVVKKIKSERHFGEGFAMRGVFGLIEIYPWCECSACGPDNYSDLFVPNSRLRFRRSR